MTDDFKKGGRYYDIYQRLYQFHKAYAGADTTDQWNDLAKTVATEPENEFEGKLREVVFNEIHRAYQKRLRDKQSEGEKRQ